MFHDLMTGLDEFDAFLAGKTAGYKADSSAEADPGNEDVQLVEEAVSILEEKLPPRRH